MSHIAYAGKTSWKHDALDIPKVSDEVVEYIASILEIVPPVEGVDEEFDRNVLKLNEILTCVQNHARSISERLIVIVKQASIIANGQDPIIEVDGVAYSLWEWKIQEMFMTIDQQNRTIGTLLGWAETTELKKELASLTLINLELSKRLRNLYLYPTDGKPEGAKRAK